MCEFFKIMSFFVLGLVFSAQYGHSTDEGDEFIDLVWEEVSSAKSRISARSISDAEKNISEKKRNMYCEECDVVSCLELDPEDVLSVESQGSSKSFINKINHMENILVGDNDSCKSDVLSCQEKCRVYRKPRSVQSRQTLKAPPIQLAESEYWDPRERFSVIPAYSVTIEAQPLKQRYVEKSTKIHKQDSWTLRSIFPFLAGVGVGVLGTLFYTHGWGVADVLPAA